LAEPVCGVKAWFVKVNAEQFVQRIMNDISQTTDEEDKDNDWISKINKDEVIPGVQNEEAVMRILELSAGAIGSLLKGFSN
jgi:hypothetical protein